MGRTVRDAFHSAKVQLVLKIQMLLQLPVLSAVLMAYCHLCLLSLSHQIDQAMPRFSISMLLDVQRGAPFQSLLGPEANRPQSVRPLIFVTRQIYGSSLPVSTAIAVPSPVSSATGLRKAAYRTLSKFMICWTSSSLKLLPFPTSGEQTTSRRKSFATSSITSGGTLGNRLEYVAMRAFSQIVLIRRGNPNEWRYTAAIVCSGNNGLESEFPPAICNLWRIY